jgi:hypothetical protein
VPTLRRPRPAPSAMHSAWPPAGQCCLNVLRAGRLCSLCCRGSGDCACSGGWPRRQPPGKRRTATCDLRPGRGAGTGSATTHAVAAAAAALVSAAASHRHTAMLYCTIQDKVEVGACCERARDHGGGRRTVDAGRPGAGGRARRRGGQAPGKARRKPVRAPYAARGTAAPSV